MITILDLKQAPQYLGILANWHHNEWAHYNPAKSLQQRIDSMKTYLSDDFIPSTFVATDNKILGSAAIVKNDMETRMDLSPWLASVYVEPDSRKKGTGTLLVNHVMRLAKRNGMKTLYLFTPDREEFYENVGWVTISEELYHDNSIYIMEARLNANK